MQLYATTTSERATKTQGGNQFLKSTITLNNETIIEIEIRKVENRVNDFYLHVKKQGKDICREVIKERSIGSNLKKYLNNPQ